MLERALSVAGVSVALLAVASFASADVETIRIDKTEPERDEFIALL